MDVARSEIAHHANETGCRIDFDGMKVVDRETNWMRRVVKDAIWTKKLASHNRMKHDIGEL